MNIFDKLTFLKNKIIACISVCAYAAMFMVYEISYLAEAGFSFSQMIYMIAIFGLLFLAVFGIFKEKKAALLVAFVALLTIEGIVAFESAGSAFENYAANNGDGNVIAYFLFTAFKAFLLFATLVVLVLKAFGIAPKVMDLIALISMATAVLCALIAFIILLTINNAGAIRITAGLLAFITPATFLFMYANSDLQLQ